MGKFFHRLARDCKGAVTVFVTLLLIPAVLVSGTGVDLARLYTARSILHDANQLAANSVLASYDALLQDLYGLYGVMKDDPEFAAMVDEYIQVAVFGEDWVDREEGTFQLFYGSELIPGDVTPAEGKNLANQEVLRRQIEEYAKFRAPAIIVSEILDKLDSFEKVQEDAAVIKDKMEIEDRIEEIDRLYKRIYKSIQYLNGIKDYEASAMESVNAYIDALEDEIDYLYTTRSDYTEAVLNEQEEKAADYEAKYERHILNIQALIKGGTYFKGWIPGNDDGSGNYVPGYWTSQAYQTGLNNVISDRTEALEKCIQNTDTDLSIENSFEEFCALCQKADEKREELEQLVDNLENRLNSGKCSEGLKDGLTKPPENDPDGPSIIERYRDVLSYDVSAMADAMAGQDVPQIQATIERLNSVGYGDPDVNIFHSRDYMKDLSLTDLPINVILENQSRGPDNQVEDKLALLDSVMPDRYTVPGTFEPFESNAFQSTKNPEFYARLQEFYSRSGSGSGGSSGDDEDAEDNILDTLEDILGQIQDQFVHFLEFKPEGALHYKNGSNDAGGVSTDFGMAGDWGSEDGAKDQVKKALNNNLLSSLGNAATDAADKILLLTYDSEMFSCYSTNKGGGENAPVEESMSGIPLGVGVNYYYQSELEYLYNGDLTSAENNLKSVTGMLFLVRFVFNYVASFAVADVVNTVSSVESALAWTGPFAIVAGELVRLAMALGESVIDVSRLKDGQNVALLKTSDNWRFSLSGQLDAIASGGEASLSDGAFSAEGAQDDEGLTLGYKDYLRLFLLLKDGNTLAQRTARLIELNVTNKRENIGDLADRDARETAMAQAELFRMENAVTDFSITTSVELKMLFLSMPFAQQGVNGVVPPGTLPVSVTDYRGY